MALKIKQLERVSHKPHYRRKTLHGSRWEREVRYPEIRSEEYEEHPDINFEHHGLRGFKGPKRWRRKNYI